MLRQSQNIKVRKQFFVDSKISHLKTTKIPIKITLNLGGGVFILFPIGFCQDCRLNNQLGVLSSHSYISSLWNSSVRWSWKAIVLFHYFFFSPLFSSGVFGNLKQFSEFSHNSPKSQTVLGSAQYFSKVWNSSQKSQTLLTTLRKFSEASKSFRTSETGLKSVKYFSVVSNCSRNFQTVLGSIKKFSELSHNSRKSQILLQTFKQLLET